MAPEAKLKDSPKVYNVNVGVVGHVDSGKTSLVAALSTTLSTAALDKNPQSKERGITLDLGFSSFTRPPPPRLDPLGFDQLQFTLVDCPGHASLIRTIVGGAQIIDMMLLVIDVTKGVQAQTAECLVVGEVATQHLIVALNKVDMLPEDIREKAVRKAKKKLAQTFAFTRFRGCTIIPVAAKPGGGEGPGPPPIGVETLVDALESLVPASGRSLPTGPFLFAVDHCFGVKGQGTVLTGTVLSGVAKVGDTLELPELRVSKKIKSMQMFKRPVQSCRQGDRAGICVTQLDAGLLERGLACTPGSVPTFTAAIAALEKIRFYTGKVASKQKVHVMVGHSTVMAEIQFFGTPDGMPSKWREDPVEAATQRIGELAMKGAAFDMKQEYLHQEELYGLEGRTRVGPDGVAMEDSFHHGPQWGVLKFNQPVTAPADALVIGARLDADLSAPTCRLAFYGRLVALLEGAAAAQLRSLQVYKLKRKTGSIERILADGRTAVCKGMFKKETDISLFSGMKVTTATGEVGRIEGSFGKSGKFKVSFSSGIQLPSKEAAGITLTFKRFLYDQDKHRMLQ